MRFIKMFHFYTAMGLKSDKSEKNVVLQSNHRDCNEIGPETEPCGSSKCFISILQWICNLLKVEKYGFKTKSQ